MTPFIKVELWLLTVVVIGLIVTKALLFLSGR